MKLHQMILAASLAFGGAGLMVGCDDTIESTETKDVKNDGTVVKEKESVKQQPDGTIVKEETKKVDRPNN
jgi:hypothetical protein